MKALLLIYLIPLLMSSLLVFDFGSNSDWSGWEIENDTVMGGVSNSKLSRSENGHAVFTGAVSLDNNGGFASMQYHFPPKNISGYSTAVIRLKGDGKDYQFRIKANLRERADYIYSFKTTGEWQTVEIPLNKMEPSYHGEKLNIPNFNADQIQEVRFMIGNGKAEKFRLEVDKIELK